MRAIGASSDLCDAFGRLAPGGGRKLAMHDEPGRIVAKREMCAMQARDRRRE
jgi:hypothetical protein